MRFVSTVHSEVYMRIVSTRETVQTDGMGVLLVCDMLITAI